MEGTYTMRVNTKNILAVILVNVVLLSGCASLSDERMIPDMGSINLAPTNATINIIILKGNIVDKGDAEFYESNLEDEMLKDAVTKTIDSSGLFKNIATSEKADFKLIVMNKRHNVRTSYDQTAHSLITIGYKLKNNASNEIVWQKDISSVGECTLKEAYNTFIRHNTATERAVKKNLLKSIQAISEHIQ
ncbi:hypothetical protein ACFL5W_02090 [Thermodesulfobacteriota bacterium]